MKKLAAYATSLWSWNERLNLTRHTDVEKFVARDVADSVMIAPHLAHGERILDVGTGGGVPGVILAIVRPDLKVDLSDSVGKRARAVRAIVSEVGLVIRVHDGAPKRSSRSRAQPRAGLIRWSCGPLHRWRNCSAGLSRCATVTAGC